MRRLASTALLAGSLLAAAPAFAEPVNYTVDKSHAAVTFTVTHFGFSTVHGRFDDFDGSLVLDQDKPANSQVSFTVKAASIDTQWAKRDEHLRTADFFDANKYPDITFKSTKVVPEAGDKNTAKVTGDLTLHGVTKPVTFEVKLNKLAQSPISQKETAGITAEATIKRSEFGMTTYVPMISDEIPIRVDFEAVKS